MGRCRCLAYVLLFSACCVLPLGKRVGAQQLRMRNTQEGAQYQITTQQYKFLQFLNYLQLYYVDTLQSEKEYVETAIESVLAELDPHSSFMPSSEAQGEMDALTGHFEGVGVEFAIVRDTLNVAGVIPGGPCDTRGVRPGDRIVAVDGDPISGKELTNKRVFDLLRGPKGTKVLLTILRGGETLQFQITRDKIPLLSVDVSYMLSPGVGYLRLNRFTLESFNEFNDALKRLSKQGAKRYVVDLRGNGGGVLQSAVEVASLFLHKEALVTYAQGRAVARTDFFVKERTPKNWRDVPLVLLVDEYSASASEILAGALQDWDRAVIIGRRTFGKGLVQNQINLLDGSLIRITVARYYTPSGRMIQTPYRMGERKEYHEKFTKRYYSGELFHADSVHVNDSLLVYTLKSGRPVYGGGGILPDVFVPLDTLREARYVNSLDRIGVLMEFAFDYCTNHADSLKGLYRDMESFASNFTLKSQDMQELGKRVREKAIKGVNDSLQSLMPLQRELLTRRVCAYMIRNLYSFPKMVQYLNSFSPEIQRAQQLFKNWSTEGEGILRGHRED